MSQAQNASVGAVSGLNPLSYLNPNYPNQVLSVGAARAPTTSDKNYAVGTVWRDTLSGSAYILVDVSAGSANWSIASTDPAALTSLEADAGDTTVDGSANTLLLAGTSNQIVTTGDNTAHSITFSLPADVAITTSLDVPLISPAAGDLTVQLGDSAGVNSFSVTDNLTNPKLDVASDGTVTLFSNLTSGSGPVAIGPSFSGDVQVTLGDNAGSKVFSILDSDTAQVAYINSDGLAQLLDLSVYSTISIGAGAGSIGSATLVAGTVTVANANIQAGNKIFLSVSNINSSTALGILTYSISDGVSFTITSVQPGTPASTETNDVSIVSYIIFRG